MRRLPSLTALLVFEAAARLENLSRAGEELGITHGAVSRQVQALEKWARVPLFDRRGRRLSLTDAGRVYGRSLTAAFDGIVAAGERLHTTAGRRLTVNALPTFALRWLIPRLPRFVERSPGVELRLVTSDVALERVGDPYDVAIRRGPEAWPGHASRPFLEEQETPACSPTLLARQALAEPRDLARHVLLEADTRPGAWDRWLALAGLTDLQTAGRLRFDHFYVALQAALDGLGVALAPLPLIEDDLRGGRLTLPVPQLVVRTRQYHLVIPQRAADDPVVASFAAWLEEEARSPK